MPAPYVNSIYIIQWNTAERLSPNIFKMLISSCQQCGYHYFSLAVMYEDCTRLYKLKELLMY